ncbi:N-methyl-L-tryptophan oxidase [Jiangella sp. DSM 45060]|uniref:N-methyl-L-tryptophan oxidase n=1 Tax=Jiangella sp. DSM 45060 TaxID=1798224 RepID=UPI00087D43B0|nr:N-methyl-L-tryptophan oxidase [Jiangella sp. DSM 45060]SDS53769.1 sarcosine oxidase [Jiangella sp. DSM 45060]
MSQHDAEAAVIGVGSIGSMALWRLAGRGVTVHGFDQFGVPHDRSAMGGETRMFRSTSPREPVYVPFGSAALALWRELEAQTGRELLRLNGELVLGPANAEHIVNVLESVRAYGLEHELLDTGDVAARYPQHRLWPGDIGILDPNAGYLRPELAVLSAAQRARELGAVVHTYTPVLRVEIDGDGVSVVTEDRTFRYGRVIVAGGPWVDRLAPQLAGKIQVRRPIQVWYAADDPAAYTPERFPIALRPEDDGFYAFPSLDGATVKVGPTGPFKEVVPDPDLLERTVGVDEVRTLDAIVARCLPGLHPDPVRVSAHMDGYTSDNRPIAGFAAGTDRVVLLGGFSGLGFKYAPAFGEAGTELLLDGSTTFDLKPFAPGRDLADWTTPPASG